MIIKDADRTFYYSRLDTVIGPIHIASTHQGLCALFPGADGQKKLRNWLDRQFGKYVTVEDHLEHLPVIQQLEEYFAGKRKTFDVPLDLYGTDFQKKVWNRLSQIPYGKTQTYGEVAMSVGGINYSRAVGSANGKNPVSIIIPCHRVIGSDASLTGYASGLDIKKALLDLESANPEK